MFVFLRALDRRRSGPRAAPARRRSLLEVQAAGASHPELQGRPRDQVRRLARLPRRGVACFHVSCCSKWSRHDDRRPLVEDSTLEAKWWISIGMLNVKEPCHPPKPNPSPDPAGLLAWMDGLKDARTKRGGECGEPVCLKRWLQAGWMESEWRLKDWPVCCLFHPQVKAGGFEAVLKNKINYTKLIKVCYAEKSWGDYTFLTGRGESLVWNVLGFSSLFSLLVRMLCCRIVSLTNITHTFVFLRVFQHD